MNDLIDIIPTGLKNFKKSFAVNETVL